MSVHTLIREQFIPASIEQVWDFFSNPANLANITPSKMNFRVTSAPHEGEIYPGQIITYKVSPLLGIPLSWMTEISQVVHRKMFIDTQLKGPYKIWHHQHHFIPVGSGVLMKDIVHYELPLYGIGDIVHKLFIKRELKSIFDYRRDAVTQHFK